jgi:RNA:NAD 2'-phosphotransferase (TPT1/KptA family)
VCWDGDHVPTRSRSAVLTASRAISLRDTSHVVAAKIYQWVEFDDGGCIVSEHPCRRFRDLTTHQLPRLQQGWQVHAQISSTGCPARNLLAYAMNQILPNL